MQWPRWDPGKVFSLFDLSCAAPKVQAAPEKVVCGRNFCCSAPSATSSSLHEGTGNNQPIFVLSGHVEQPVRSTPCGHGHSKGAGAGDFKVKMEVGGPSRFSFGFAFASPNVESAEEPPDDRPKGGLCTQALLAALQGGWHREVSSKRGDGQGDSLDITFHQLLDGMHKVVSSVGFPSATLTLRSSIDLSLQYGAAQPVARALPRARDCGDSPRALLIGICYVESPEWQLEGAWNDVLDMRSWLVGELKWPESAIRMLVDYEARRLPTREGILRELAWLLEDDGQSSSWPYRGVGVGRGVRLLHFCGHGAETELYPCDWQSAGTIGASGLARAVETHLPKGATFTCILDSCCSSSFFSTLGYRLQLPRVSVRPPTLQAAVR